MAEGRVLAEGTPESMKENYGGKEDSSETSMEDAFIGLIQAHQHAEGAA